jgi:hypothetical protein
MGTFMFQSLRFKPSVDYVKLEWEEGDTNKEFADLWGIHFDWYWYFMATPPCHPLSVSARRSITTILNVMRRKILTPASIFLPVWPLPIAGTPFELFIEGRYKIVDIAAASDDNIGQVNLGVQFRF